MWYKAVSGTLINLNKVQYIFISGSKHYEDRDEYFVMVGFDSAEQESVLRLHKYKSEEEAQACLEEIWENLK